MYARVEVFDFRLDCVEGTGSMDAMDDNLVPDFILRKTSSCKDGGSEASSMARQWALRTERAGVLSLVISLTWWLVVKSMVAIRGFLIAELIPLPIVRLLVLSGSAVPFLSMTIVLSRLVKTEVGGFSF